LFLDEIKFFQNDRLSGRESCPIEAPVRRASSSHQALKSAALDRQLTHQLCLAPQSVPHSRYESDRRKRSRILGCRVRENRLGVQDRLRQ
jgi:hypothetical protein